MSSQDLPSHLDYLAKDYASFRQLMLDHLSFAAPGWPERHAADLGITIIEVLAYVADYLSYYQDSVSAEAYLQTARQRISIRRHARLLDYRLNEGCNARVWVHLETASDQVRVPQGTPLLTKTAGMGVRVSAKAMESYDGNWFETMHDVALMRAHNKMILADEHLAAPGKDNTSTKLKGHYPHLRSGDVIVFHQQTEGGSCQAVRLKSVSLINGEEATRIDWHEEDELAADITSPGAPWIVYGNIVLADHGRSMVGTKPLSPVPCEGRYAPSFICSELTHLIPYHHADAAKLSATQAMQQNPNAAEPAIILHEKAAFLAPSAVMNRPVWIARRDIVHAGEFDREFVAEVGNRGEIHLRFSDGIRGRKPQPEWSYIAHYRSGQGVRGNIGPGTLAHVVSDDTRIIGVFNPLAASGGADPETIAHARAAAPLAMEELRRCVIEGDYVAMANQFPGVESSVAHRSWTADRPVVSIYVNRLDRRPVDESFSAKLYEYLAPFQLIGDEVRILPAQSVVPIVTLEITVFSGWTKASVVEAVRAALLITLRFNFGDPLYPSQLIDCAKSVAGVASARVVDLRRSGMSGPNAAPIVAGPQEIIRLSDAPGVLNVTVVEVST